MPGSAERKLKGLRTNYLITKSIPKRRVEKIEDLIKHIKVYSLLLIRGEVKIKETEAGIAASQVK